MDSTNHPINQKIATFSSKTPNKRYHIIILSFLSSLIIILGITNIAVYVTRNYSPNNDTDTSETNNNANDVDNNTDDITRLDTFEDLTKEKAMAFLQSQTGTTSALPKNYVGKEILNAIIENENVIVSDLNLIHSHDTIEELKEMARKEYTGFKSLLNGNAKEYDDSFFEIKEYDYYAIVTPKRIKDATTCDHGYNDDCDSLLSFKRRYLDYRQEETSYNSFHDAYYLKTRDPDIINYLLRILSFFRELDISGHGSIYSYSFEEEDDKYILTVNNVGAGINMDMFKNPDNYTNDSEKYAINLYLKRFAADKSDGHIYVIPTETGIKDYIKSFTITEEELQSLIGYS